MSATNAATRDAGLNRHATVPASSPTGSPGTRHKDEARRQQFERALSGAQSADRGAVSGRDRIGSGGEVPGAMADAADIPGVMHVHRADRPPDGVEAAFVTGPPPALVGLPVAEPLAGGDVPPRWGSDKPPRILPAALRPNDGRSVARTFPGASEAASSGSLASLTAAMPLGTVLRIVTETARHGPIACTVRRDDGACVVVVEVAPTRLHEVATIRESLEADLGHLPGGARVSVILRGPIDGDSALRPVEVSRTPWAGSA